MRISAAKRLRDAAERAARERGAEEVVPEHLPGHRRRSAA